MPVLFNFPPYTVCARFVIVVVFVVVVVVVSIFLSLSFVFFSRSLSIVCAHDDGLLAVTPQE